MGLLLIRLVLEIKMYMNTCKKMIYLYSWKFHLIKKLPLVIPLEKYMQVTRKNGKMN